MIYVILPKDIIGEVMRGERSTLPVELPANIGAIVAVKVARNRKPTILLTVTACEPDPEGYTLTVRARPLEHVPLLLAADSSRGYTSDPRLAMVGEPEAVDTGSLDVRWRFRAGRKHEKAVTEKQDVARRSRELLSTEDRMRNARDAARLNHVDVRDEMKALAHMQRRGRSEGLVVQELQRVERIAYREAA
ncbi:MAG TPA: hypothetical protein VK631_03575 [Solirubrobacteraceae bacterium]|nr:hypothetical protein [Solirubrobacteraceae bacterium]